MTIFDLFLLNFIIIGWFYFFTSPNVLKLKREFEKDKSKSKDKIGFLFIW